MLTAATEYDINTMFRSYMTRNLKNQKIERTRIDAMCFHTQCYQTLQLVLLINVT